MYVVRLTPAELVCFSFGLVYYFMGFQIITNYYIVLFYLSSCFLIMTKVFFLLLLLLRNSQITHWHYPPRYYRGLGRHLQKANKHSLKKAGSS